MTRRALVVGGGIGGLAAAVGLCRAGWAVTVRERADRLAGSGTGLSIWPEAVRALDRLGLGAALRESGIRQSAGTIRRADGRRVATVDAATIERRTGGSVYLVSRPALLGMLHDALPDGVVRFGAEVTDPVAAASGYDLMIGADGIASRVRGALFGRGHRVRYTGATAWRGVVEMDLAVAGESWDPGRKFGHTPLEPGRVNWYAAVRVPEAYQPPAGDIAALGAWFGDWHDPIPAILARLAPEGILRHPLHYLDPPLPSYVAGNVALLGDAAHAMPPDLGQGACQAMIDGLVLAECLAGATDLPAGLAAYDRRRRPASQRIAALARQVGRMSMAARFTGLRDLTTRALLAVTSPGG